MNRQEKQALVDRMRDQLNQSELVLVSRQSGLTVGESSALRAEVRASGATYRVSKNTLSRLAVKDTPFEALTSLLNGPTALAMSIDPIAAAKAVVGFAKGNNKVEVLGGVLQGKVLSRTELEALATLPSLDVLRGRLVGMLQTPATRLACLAAAPATALARVCSAYAAKSE